MFPLTGVPSCKIEEQISCLFFFFAVVVVAVQEEEEKMREPSSVGLFLLVCDFLGDQQLNKRVPSHSSWTK